jgi:hypothetical protein
MSKRAFRSRETSDAAAYPTFEVAFRSVGDRQLGRRSFLRKLGLLAAGVAAGGALVGCGERNVGEDDPITLGGAPDAMPSIADGGVAPMPEAGIDRGVDKGVDKGVDTRPPYAGLPNQPDAGIDFASTPDAFGGVPDMKPADLDTKRDAGTP